MIPTPTTFTCIRMSPLAPVSFDMHRKTTGGGDAIHLVKKSRACALNYRLPTANYDLIHLTPLPGTLTNDCTICKKTAPLTPLDAILTDNPSGKYFGWHSYEKQRGGEVSNLVTGFSLFHSQPKGRMRHGQERQ
jgi:hypothetical protein